MLHGGKHDPSHPVSLAEVCGSRAQQELQLEGCQRLIAWQLQQEQRGVSGQQPLVTVPCCLAAAPVAARSSLAAMHFLHALSLPCCKHCPCQIHWI